MLPDRDRPAVLWRLAVDEQGRLVSTDVFRAVVRSRAQLSYTQLQDEFDRTVRVVLNISETPQLLDKEPVIQRSIRVRNPYVDPINYIQVALLRRLRTESNPEAANRLRSAVLLSVNGIAAGLQNVG